MRLLGELGADAARERAARRLEAFVAAEASRLLFVLSRLKAAMADGRLKGLARGLAYQLVEQFGVLDRGTVETQVRALSQKERRTLKGARRAFRRLQPLSAGAFGVGGAGRSATAFAELGAAGLAARAAAL